MQQLENTKKALFYTGDIHEISSSKRWPSLYNLCDAIPFISTTYAITSKAIHTSLYSTKNARPFHNNLINKKLQGDA